MLTFQKSAGRLGNCEMQGNELINPCEQCEYAAAEENPMKTHCTGIYIKSII